MKTGKYSTPLGRAVAVALSMLMLAVASPAAAQSYVRLQNVWSPQLQINAEAAGPALASIASPGWLSADWIIEQETGRNSVRIKNRWRGTYLAVVEAIDPLTGFEGVGLKAGENVATEKWVFVEVPGRPGAYRIRNLTTPDRWLNVERGRLMLSEAGPAFLSAQWLTRPSRGGAAPKQCVKNLSGTVLKVEWYKARDVTFRRVATKMNTDGTPLETTLAPERLGAMDSSDTIPLLFSACKNTGEFMYAVVRMKDRDKANLAVGAPAGIAAFIGSSPLCMTGAACGGPILIGAFAADGVAKLLPKNETWAFSGVTDPLSVAYMGLPVDIAIRGTIWVPTVEEYGKLAN